MSAVSDRRRFFILAAALTVPAVVIATQLFAGYRIQRVRVSYPAVLILQIFHWELWAVAGPLVWNLERRWPLERRNAFLKHLAAAPLVATAVLGVYLALYHALIRFPPLAPWFTRMDRSFVSTAAFFGIAYFHLELLLYCATVAAAHAVHTTMLLRAREHESLRLEAELTGARLAGLRTQLQPHFLFNTLHTIGSLILQQRGDRAVQLVAELGELLRSTLAKRDTDLAPLSEELVDIRRYLRIEEARFGDRLRVEWSVDHDALNALVPPFILQPIVENAFKHGIARRASAATLEIAAGVEHDSLRITIYNDGPPLADPFSIATAGGYGLKNVEERLRTRHPLGSIDLANVAGGVRATLRLPRWDLDGARRQP